MLVLLINWVCGLSVLFLTQLGPPLAAEVGDEYFICSKFLAEGLISSMSQGLNVSAVVHMSIKAHERKHAFH